ncbi:ATP-binding protein [Laribacter hongkongensis]|uniref:ATP-binding protein n=1 Tax=Laribacter hongkongensis TaxID=168471 RepID=UPI001EFDEE70|nr:ATP-binding protein [Laribacter hongkongensis]MCG9124987.1 ATP-binding protein [Laribacter hongkongensis]
MLFFVLHFIKNIGFVMKLKRINLLSLVQAYKSLPEDIFNQFLHYSSISIKDEEIDDLSCLVGLLRKEGGSVSIFEKFYVGYSIPQIGKEFDLLRFDSDCVINVELKRNSTEEKIKKQLRRNNYYLSFIGRRICCYCFISETKSLYMLDDAGEVKSVDLGRLILDLESMQIGLDHNINNLFDPANYLVSPFNSTDRFVRGEYFLTQHQEKIADAILNLFDEGDSATYVSIKGSAGTGKTLLTYDIVRRLMSEDVPTLIIHCGNLNQGHKNLIERLHFEIIPVKDVKYTDISRYKVVVLDEAQRIYTSQLDLIIKAVGDSNGLCIFSYDKKQTLAKWEENQKNDEIIGKIPGIHPYSLNEKIRTNHEIAYFVKNLFQNRTVKNSSHCDNVELNYFSDENDAKDYIGSLRLMGWKVLRFTPSQYYNERHEKYSDAIDETSHGVIGQEFDNVAIVMDEFFGYNENGDLVYSGSAYYDPVKMLFQNITRTRKRLNIVFIMNRWVFDRCTSILGGTTTISS